MGTMKPNQQFKGRPHQKGTKTGVKAADMKKKKKGRSYKDRIRGLERLLKKEDLDPRARKAKEVELEELKQSQVQHLRASKERKFAQMYHKVKFFERVKIERRLQSLQKKAQQELTEAEEQLMKSLQDDLLYIKHYPKDQRYVSLLRTADTAKAQNQLEESRAKMRAVIRAKLAEVAMVTEADEGLGSKHTTEPSAAGDAAGAGQEDSEVDDFFLDDPVQEVQGAPKDTPAVPAAGAKAVNTAVKGEPAAGAKAVNTAVKGEPAAGAKAVHNIAKKGSAAGDKEMRTVAKREPAAGAKAMPSMVKRGAAQLEDSSGPDASSDEPDAEDKLHELENVGKRRKVNEHEAALQPSAPGNRINAEKNQSALRRPAAATRSVDDKPQPGLNGKQKLQSVRDDDVSVEKAAEHAGGGDSDDDHDDDIDNDGDDSDDGDDGGGVGSGSSDLEQSSSDLDLDMLTSDDETAGDGDDVHEQTPSLARARFEGGRSGAFRRGKEEDDDDDDSSDADKDGLEDGARFDEYSDDSHDGGEAEAHENESLTGRKQQGGRQSVQNGHFQQRKQPVHSSTGGRGGGRGSGKPLSKFGEREVSRKPAFGRQGQAFKDGEQLVRKSPASHQAAGSKGWLGKTYGVPDKPFKPHVGNRFSPGAAPGSASRVGGDRAAQKARGGGQTPDKAGKASTEPLRKRAEGGRKRRKKKY